MKVTLQKQAILSALNRVSRSAGKTGIVAYAYIATTADGISVGCTDLDVCAVEKVPGSVEEPGECAISARMLLERVKAMPSGEVVLHVDDAAVLLSGQTTRRFTLPTPSAVGDSPIVTPDDSVEPLFSMTAIGMHAMVHQVEFSISQDSTRPALNSMLVELADGALRFVSTDGKRLTLIETSETGNATVLVSLRGVQELVRMLASLKEDSEVFVYRSGDSVSFVSGDKTLTVKQIQDAYPTYRQILPRDAAKVIATAPRAALIDAIKAVALSSADDRRVKFMFGPGTIALHAVGVNSGDAIDEVPSECNGTMTMYFNADYVLDPLTALECEEVKFMLGGEVEPCAIKPLDSDGFVAIVMPMRA